MKRLPEDLAAKLLDVSDELPKGRGFDITIDEMAKLAGIPRATLYYYFSGRADLVQFYLNDKLERTAQAIEKAAAGEGTLVERLESVLTAILHALAAHPRMCVELPAALKAIDEFEGVVANAQRWVLSPLREILIEGRTTGELVVPDVDLAAVSLVGALNMVGMFQIVTTGTFDAETTAQALVPQLMRGLLPR